MRFHLLTLALLVWGSGVVQAQESYKVEILDDAPPEAIADRIRNSLQTQGYRVLDEQGKPYADIWLRKAIPVYDPPAGPRGAVQFPFLSDGYLLGALRFPSDGYDYRDQPIAAGVYTLRYGLQPVDGDHLGVSPYRDYALLIHAEQDENTRNLARKDLEERSAEAASSSHPATLMILSVPSGTPADEPTLIHDEENETWGVVLPLVLEVDDEDEPETVVFPVQLVIFGTAPV